MISKSSVIAGDVIEQLIRTPPPRRECLVQDRKGRPILLRGCLAMLAGAGGAGKSTLALDLAVCVVLAKILTGEPRRWADAWTVPNTAAGSVLVVLGEEDEAGALRRLKKSIQRVCAGPPSPEIMEAIKGLDLVYGRGRLDLRLQDDDGYGSSSLASLKAQLRRRDDWSLIVLDPLCRIGGRKVETDNAVAAEMCSILEGLCDAPGRPTVLVTHHTNKTNRKQGGATITAIRGCNTLVNGFRWVAQITSDYVPGDVPQVARLQVVKSNDTAFPPPVDLVRAKDGTLRKATPEDLMANSVARMKLELEAKAREHRIKKAAEAEVITEDLWTPKIEAWLTGKDSVWTNDILTEALGVVLANTQHGTRETRRIAQIMRRLGWVRGRILRNGRRLNGWRKPRAH